MCNRTVVAWSIGILALFGNPASAESANAVCVIPRPLKVHVGAGVFRLTAATQIQASPEAMPIGTFLKDLLTPATGFSLALGEVVPDRQHSNTILLTTSMKLSALSDEGYELEIRPDIVVIRAAKPAGLFYGVQTLRQLLPPALEHHSVASDVKWEIPVATIVDQPRFRWRGMHLDVARHIFPTDFVKRYIDLLAMHKMNVLHWHLTDDQGWRIEIMKYPKLTEVGSQRRSTPLAHDPQRSDESPYGGFYTQDEIRDVVSYAAARFVTVVPEIDIPGHVLAALASYPELGCTEGPYQVGTRWQVETDIMCAGKTHVYSFVEGVFEEVLDLFPSEFIHVGGDECPRSRWDDCRHCQALIAEKGLQNSDALQGYFTNRLGAMLRARGRQLIGWDEILDGKPSPECAIMCWRNSGTGRAAARAGHVVVMAPAAMCYFSISQQPAYVTLERVYGFNPIPLDLSPEEGDRIRGVEGCIWTEGIAIPSEVEYLALPRMSALAEVAWSQSEARDLNDFKRRLIALEQRFEILGLNFYNPPYLVDLYLRVGKRRLCLIVGSLLATLLLIRIWCRRRTARNAEPRNVELPDIA